ncbi:hypothetical protein ACJX0J_009504, partial [Zea mays]
MSWLFLMLDFLTSKINCLSSLQLFILEKKNLMAHLKVWLYSFDMVAIKLFREELTWHNYENEWCKDWDGSKLSNLFLVVHTNLHVDTVPIMVLLPFISVAQRVDFWWFMTREIRNLHFILKKMLWENLGCIVLYLVTFKQYDLLVLDICCLFHMLTSFQDDCGQYMNYTFVRWQDLIRSVSDMDN